MPITIKEILNSDTMSGFVEKVNFNFDQLILAGGGPPGPPGLQGIAGPVGPQGRRGDHWFTGASALGQTADHDGVSPLQVQDNFLDENGDIYNYFDNGSGLTGWIYSGINLKGVTGATGATGGGTEWKMFESTNTGGAPGLPYFGPIPIPTTGTPNMDFIVPERIDKNSIFLGDPTWAYSKLVNYGYNYTTSTNDGSATPLLTLIQRNMNTSGMNGLGFGGYGVDTTNLHGSSYSDNSGNTDSTNFVYLGYKQNETSSGSGQYATWFGMRSLRSPIEINAGDASFGTFIPLTLTGNRIKIASYESNDSEAKMIDMRPDNFFNILGLFVNKERGLLLNTKSVLNVAPLAPFFPPVDTTSVYGYIGLQSIPGSIGSTSGSFGQEHAYGTVIIGPTFNSTQGAMIGVQLPQALGISRRITQEQTRDAAIRFMFDGMAGPTAGNVFASTIGTIVPIRFSDSIDALVISAGIGQGLMSNRDPGRGGRLGFTNNALKGFKPLFPSHTRIGWDDKVFGGALGSAPTSGDSNNPWFAAWDYKHKTNSYLLGTTAYLPKNDVGIGFMTVAENWTAPSGLTGGYYPMPSIQSYYTEDYDSIPNDGYSGRTQGINAPHLFMQYGDEDTNGNLALGFKPDGAVSSAYSKFHVNGGIVIGSTASFYHSPWVNRIKNGGLFENTIVQGAISFNSQFSTRFMYSSAVLDALAGPSGARWGLATYDPVLGRKFISRGTTDLGNPSGTWVDGPSANASAVPDYSGPDLRTGMHLFNAEGYLSIPDAAQPSPRTTAPTVGRSFAAMWKAFGDSNYSSNYDYPVLKPLNAFAHSIQKLTMDDLSIEVTNIDNSTTGPGGISCYYKRIWYVIPSNTTTVMLDLSKGRRGGQYFDASGNMNSVPLSQRLWFNGDLSNLDASLWNSPPTQWSGNYGGYPNRGWKIQDGHYNGQILNIIVTEVGGPNIAHLESSNLPSTGIPAVSYNLTNVPDSLVLAAEPLWGQSSGSSMINQDSPNLNRVYPIPYGYQGASTIGATALSVSAPQLNTLWSNQSTSLPWYSGGGYGAFRLLPYYSINLIWKFFDTPSRGINGAWYELGRERLVPAAPTGRSYYTPPVTTVGSGPIIGPSTTIPLPGISWRAAAGGAEIIPTIWAADYGPVHATEGWETPLTGIVEVVGGPADITVSTVYDNHNISNVRLWIYTLGTTTPIAGLPLGLSTASASSLTPNPQSTTYMLPVGTYSFSLSANFSATVFHGAVIDGNTGHVTVVSTV